MTGSLPHAHQTDSSCDPADPRTRHAKDHVALMESAEKMDFFLGLVRKQERCGVVWRSGRVLDSEPRCPGFEAFDQSLGQSTEEDQSDWSKALGAVVTFSGGMLALPLEPRNWSIRALEKAWHPGSHVGPGDEELEALELFGKEAGLFNFKPWKQSGFQASMLALEPSNWPVQALETAWYPGYGGMD
ncbi:hypothetical protein Bbelb_236430 [Branchiostoma belcheri]|nr:hypothetical protein Bbelb_236430 [Branchiostoma belcheri]